MFCLVQLTVAACLSAFVVCQVGVTDCALACVADVNGTSCAQTEWPCLCPSSIYTDRLNACVYQACTDTQSQQATFGAIANICNVFGFPPTASAEANAASTMDLSGTASILGSPTPSTIPVASSTSTSGLTILAGTNTLHPVNVTSTSASGLATSEDTQTSLPTSATTDVTDSTQSTTSSIIGSSTATATSSGSAGSVSFQKHAVYGCALIVGLAVRHV